MTWLLAASSMRLEVGEGNIQRHGAWWNIAWVASHSPSYLLKFYDGATNDELSDTWELGTWGVYEVAASACVWIEDGNHVWGIEALIPEQIRRTNHPLRPICNHGLKLKPFGTWNVVTPIKPNQSIDPLTPNQPSLWSVRNHLPPIHRI